MQNDDESWVGLGNWQDVAAGLRMFRAYAITTLSFGVLILLVTIALASSGSTSALGSLMTTARVAGIVGLAIALFGILALERYARISAVTGARATAKTALYLGIAGLVLSVVSIAGLISKSDLEAMAETNAADLLARLLGVVQMFCFLASLRTCAGYIGRLDLHELAGKTMMLLAVTIVLVIFSQVLVMSKSLALMALFGLGALGIGIWCFVFVMILLTRLAKAVQRDAHLPETFA